MSLFVVFVGSVESMSCVAFCAVCIIYISLLLLQATLSISLCRSSLALRKHSSLCVIGH